MLQSEKMAAVGRLASGVAHEINNPLGVILGFAQSALRRVPPGDPLEKALKSIERESVRCKNLVRELLAFSRASGSGRGPCAIEEVLEGALALVRPQAKISAVELSEEIEPGLPRLAANGNQLQQVVVNLCGNGIDAMTPAGGKLTVRARRKGREGADGIELQVQDTGTGIAPEVQPRVFEPFFTTKEPGRGTGLGLSLCYEIVRRHGGSIGFSTAPGKGTLFSVWVPAGRPA